MKKYIIIAGVNGAGKSTLYHSLKEMFKNTKRINVDEMIKQTGDWKDFSTVMQVGKDTVKLLNKYLMEGVSFNQETTLCGKTILKNIIKAKELGYFIELHYIGLDSVELAKKRVSNRVKEGGHGIPEKDIEKRYIESFENLREIMDICDLTIFYDNTYDFRRFAIYRKKEYVVLSHNLPRWFIDNKLL